METLFSGAAVIQVQGSAGLDKPVWSPFTGDIVRTSTLWWTFMNEVGKRDGQLVDSYLVNNIVPPASR